MRDTGARARTSEQKRHREAAEAALKEKKKAQADEHHRQELENEIRHERAAAQQEAELKRKAKQAWAAEGGLSASFEKAWPKLHESIIFDRTVARVVAGKSALPKELKL